MKTDHHRPPILGAAVLLALSIMLAGCVPGDSTAASHSAAGATQSAAPEREDSASTKAESPYESEPTASELSSEADSPYESKPSTEAIQLPYALSENSPLSSLPVYRYDSYTDYWDMENGAEMLLYTAESGAGYADYLTDLTNAGFSLYAENEIAGNQYSTWIDSETHVTLMYMPSLQSVRILAEPSSIDLPGLKSDNLYNDAGVENVMVHLGTSYDGVETSGMCFIYRLCDGSFIIVDSGFNEKACAQAIYNTLVRLAPDPDHIVITAWFLTHGHKDHAGGFYKFSATYANKITLEQVIYNYPTENSFLLSGTSANHITKTADNIKRFKGNPKIIEAHPGQEFFIRDAYVEMLFTWDMFSLNEVAYLNDSSLFFTVELADTKITMTGDCGPLAAPIISGCYGEYLATDIVQVAHHGSKGSSLELNTLFQAKVALWPTIRSHYMNRINNENNSPFRTVEYEYIANSDARLFHLPFDPEKIETWPLYE